MSSLSNIFKYVAKQTAMSLAMVALAFPVAVSIHVRIDDYQREGGRKITKSEKALLKGIFGNNLDTSGIRIHPHDKESEDAIASVEGGSRQHIDVWGSDYHSSDYSREISGLFGLFAHEATHLWQGQQWNIYLRLYKSCDQYGYELKPHSRFSDFCVEQQASIVQDYAQVFLHPTNDFFRHQPLFDPYILLQNVVEKQFPDARKTRLALTAKEKADRARKPASSPAFLEPGV